MSAFQLLKKLIPNKVKKQLQESIIEIVRQNTLPTMNYGYQDSSGQWRPRTRLSNMVFINNPDQVMIEDNVFVGHFVVLDGTRQVEIGEGTQIGSWVGIFTHSSHNAIRLYGRHYHSVPESEKKGYEAAGVKIGRYVWIGSGSLILPGVEIGDGALISAGATVMANVAPFSVITRQGKELRDGARRFDAMTLQSEKDSQLEQWYKEWQLGG